MRFRIGFTFFTLWGACLCAVQALAFDSIGSSYFEAASFKTKNFLSTGFLHSNNYHNDFNQTFYILSAKLNKDTRTDGAVKNGFVLDAFGLLKVQGEGASSYSLRELYYTGNLFSKIQYSIGRKITKWSHLESYLPTGFWNNSWDFNKSMPVEEGLFGGFIDLKISKRSKLKLFASPISVPKMTLHYKFNDDGSVGAHTPWFSPPPEEVEYQGGVFVTRYSLNLDIPALVLQPQIGGTYDWGGHKIFMKVSYLYGPSKDVDMAIDFGVKVVDEDLPVEIEVTPSATYVHKGSFELGRAWTKNIKTVVSLSYKARAEGLFSDTTNRRSYIGFTSGAVYQIAHEMTFFKERFKTVVHFVENTEIQNVSNGELDEFLLDFLSVPFRYRRGGGLKFNCQITSKLQGKFYGYYDVKSKGVMGDVKLSTKWNKVSLTAGLNFIEALNADSQGFYKDFRKNDSYYMGVSYVF